MVAVAATSIGRLWCFLMNLLERVPCTAAYAVAVTHCWFAGVVGWRIAKTYLDLARLPLLLLRREC